jgi:hypothetical protein
MQMNRVKSLEDKLEIERDIAFRELAYSMKMEQKEYKRIPLEELFPESGPVNLADEEIYP